MHSKVSPLTATDAATVSIDFSASQNQIVTIAGSRTLAFSNGQAGYHYTVAVKQDATGSRLVTWPASVKWTAAAAPTLTTTANKTDLFRFYFDGTNYFGYTTGLNY